MLVEKIEEIVNFLNASLNSQLPPEDHIDLYKFNHGAAHWQNTKDFESDSEKPFEERKKHVLFLWQDRDNIFNSHGAVTGYTFTSEILLAVRSSLSDKDYNYKYETHIKRLYAETDLIKNQFGNCDEWLLTRWKEIEIENAYDTNIDGLKIQLTATLTLD